METTLSKGPGTWGPGKGCPHVHYQTVSVSKNFTAARIELVLVPLGGVVQRRVAQCGLDQRLESPSTSEGLAQALGGMNSLKVSGSVPPGPVVFSRRCYPL